MFSNKRKENRRRAIAIGVGALLLAVGIFININDKEEMPTEKTVKKIESEKKTEQITEASQPDEVPKSYLIKAVEGVVKVYLCNSNGDKELYLITSIPYDLLSENDQKLLAEGVILDTEEDLGEFLESFDS